nr:reverse transcriptase domain-containing protein [Tanacetum cinerariifolium]
MLRACPHHGFMELVQIDTFYNGLNDNDQDSLNAVVGGNLLSKTTREALQIIENKSKVCYSRNKPNVSRMNTTSRENASKTEDRIDKLADQISTSVDIFSKEVVTPTSVKAVKESCVTCGGAHAYYNCPNTDSNQPSVCVALGTYNQNQSSTLGTLPSNTIPNPKGEMKSITTRSGVAYEGPSIPTPKKVVERETKETTDKEQTNFQGKFASMIKSLLKNKDKLFELAKIPLNENFSVILLKKLPKKPGDPAEFLIPCYFPGMDVRNKREKDKIGTKPDQIKKKREAWQSQEKVKAVTVDKERKTEQNAKRMVKNANTVRSYSKFKEENKGHICNFFKVQRQWTSSAKGVNLYQQGLFLQLIHITWRAVLAIFQNIQPLKD